MGLRFIFYHYKTTNGTSLTGFPILSSGRSELFVAKQMKKPSKAPLGATRIFLNKTKLTHHLLVGITQPLMILLRKRGRCRQNIYGAMSF